MREREREREREMPRNEKKKWVVFTFHTPMLVRKFFLFWDPKSLSRRNIQCMVFVRPGMLFLSPFSRVLHSQQSTLTLSHTHSLSPLPLFGHFKNILLHLLVYYIYIYIYINSSVVCLVGETITNATVIYTK